MDYRTLYISDLTSLVIYTIALCALALWNRGNRGVRWFAVCMIAGLTKTVLQTYMGHACPDDTAYYLRLTAESYPDICARVQQATGDVIAPITAGPRHDH